MKKNYIIFKEGMKQYTWYYENLLGDDGLIEGLREIYNCWSCSIEKVVMGYEEVSDWIEYL